MFTGIIEEVGKVTLVKPGELVISASRVLEGMELGGSIAVNGACLTVTGFDAGSFSVDIMLETLKRTNLGLLKVGGRVNLERAMTLGGRLGGHLVQGHVDDVGRIVAIVRGEGATLIRFEAPPGIMRYIVGKGFIAVDGISLTVVDYDTRSFQVSMVEYSRQHTTLNERRVGDQVNLEVDVIAKYVERFHRGGSDGGITADFLNEHGFLQG
ncbi:MAG: riboflavin synthase [Chloroflexi bacterium]|nr:riboflavin synthase [Chloroflexota bacterium]